MTNDDPIDRVLEALDAVKQTPNGWSALCPAHGDQHNSLSVAQGKDGRVLLKCFAGCKITEVTAAMGG